MWIAVDRSHADLTDREQIESVVNAALEAGRKFEGQPDLMASPTDGIEMTGWFSVANQNRVTFSPVVFVELYMDPAGDGDIPSAVTYFMRNGFDSDYPGGVDPKTGHSFGYSTSIEISIPEQLANATGPIMDSLNS